ncbi:MAG: hypothetical protein RJA57_1586 [Bacteroidota bacterium]
MHLMTDATLNFRYFYPSNDPAMQLIFRRSVVCLFHLSFLFLLVQRPVSAQKPALSSAQSDTVQNRVSKKFQQAEEQQKAQLERKRKASEQAALYSGESPVPTVESIRQFPDGTPGFLRDSLDSYVTRGLRQWEVPGLAIVVVKDGRVILSKGYGVRELNRENPIDENTLFIIASNTKLFTGTTLALLDADKKLSLEDKVSRYLPWFRLYDTLSTRQVTIRDLLCHRIGLKTFQGDFTFWDSRLPKDSIIWRMRLLKPSGVFRQDYGYCNAAFVAAGRVLEKVTGGTWESYVEQQLLRPLGMDRTYMATAGLEGRTNVAQPHTNRYRKLTTIPFDKVDNMGPATSMVSNVRDLGRWLLFQLDSGRIDGRSILPWSVVQKTRDVNIITSSRRSTAFPMHFRGYGLGLNAADYNGRQVYWHTGGAFGHVTNVCFIPEENLGIAILTNNDNQNFFESLRYQIMDAYLGVPYVDRSLSALTGHVRDQNAMRDSLATLQARVDRKLQPPVPIQEFTGTYTHPVYGRITIVQTPGGLTCRFQQHPDLFGVMDYMDDNTFRLTYSHSGYGIHPMKFTMKDGKPYSVEVRVNDFLEYDPYTFVKELRRSGK